MTTLKKPVTRVSNTPLGGGFGCDKKRRIVITIIPGNGGDVRDTFALKPERCRSGRTEYVAVEEVYRFAIQCRVNKAQLVRAREIKAKKADKRRDRAYQRGLVRP